MESHASAQRTMIHSPAIAAKAPPKRAAAESRSSEKDGTGPFFVGRRAGDMAIPFAVDGLFEGYNVVKAAVQVGRRSSQG